MTEYYYPTANNVAVFLNGYHVDQTHRIDYKDNIPKRPIFGYNDYQFTNVARGKGFVEGLLILAFTVPFYLTDVLSANKSPFVPRLYNYNIPTKSQDEQFEAKLKQSLVNDLPPNSDANSRKARAEYIAGLISKKDKALKEKIKSTLYQYFDPTKQAEDLLDAVRKREYVSNNPLEVVYNRDNGNTIDVYYTDPQDATWLTRFNDVHFTDVTQQMNQAGAEGSSEPLYEIYSWIAKNRSIILIQ